MPFLQAMPWGEHWDAESLNDDSAERIVLDLYDRERVSLERYLYWLGIDSDECRDVVHETFLKLYQHLLRQGDASQLRAWIFRVAHNLAVNSRKTAFAKKSQPLADEADKPVSELSPEQTLLRREQQEMLRSAMQSLPAAQRRCLVLRAQGFKYREIAEVLQLSTSAVAEAVQRAVATLKKSF